MQTFHSVILRQIIVIINYLNSYFSSYDGFFKLKVQFIVFTFINWPRFKRTIPSELLKIRARTNVCAHEEYLRKNKQLSMTTLQ